VILLHHILRVNLDSFTVQLYRPSVVPLFEEIVPLKSQPFVKKV
jgi:hypothetical protein